jgi:hypothetical protein
MEDRSSPDECLVRFKEELAPAIRRELCIEIIRVWGKREQETWPENFFPHVIPRLLQPREFQIARRRTILTVGLIDHFVATGPLRETPDQQFLGVSSLNRQQWEFARPPWLTLCAGDLAPVNIDDITRYRINRAARES